mgnify:CR=1 FL=1
MVLITIGRLAAKGSQNALHFPNLGWRQPACAEGAQPLENSASDEKLYSVLNFELAFTSWPFEKQDFA